MEPGGNRAFFCPIRGKRRLFVLGLQKFKHLRREVNRVKSTINQQMV
jgi:hypothetical protein